jgi:hypothetical protein
VLPQSMRGIMFVDGTNGARIVSAVGATSGIIFRVGSNVIQPFYMNAAPAGWTINGSLNDYGMRVVSSSGGGTTGTSPYTTSLINTVAEGYSGSIGIAGHAISIAEMAAHTHTVNASSFNNNLSPSTGTSSPQSGSGTSSSTGGGSSHYHAITLGVQTAAFILAQYTG